MHHHRLHDGPRHLPVGGRFPSWPHHGERDAVRFEGQYAGLFVRYADARPLSCGCAAPGPDSNGATPGSIDPGRRHIRSRPSGPEAFDRAPLHGLNVTRDGGGRPSKRTVEIVSDIASVASDCVASDCVESDYDVATRRAGENDLRIRAPDVRDRQCLSHIRLNQIR